MPTRTKAAKADPIARVRKLLDPQHADAPVRDGYVDLLGATQPTPPTVSQRLMQFAPYGIVYERLVRPRMLELAAGGFTVEDENRLTSELLALSPGDIALDIACGPGNTTRRLLDDVGPTGLAVGFDAATPMLARAVNETPATNAVYVRGDAQALPFADGSFDAVSCYAALYMFGDPHGALAEMARVLKPGGRVAIMTSCHRGPFPMRLALTAGAWPSGFRFFGREEITRRFQTLGLTDVTQRVSGFAQYAAAQK